MEFLSGLIGSAKQLTPALLIGVAITCGGALFMPPQFLEQLGLTALVKEHRTYIGSALLISLALLLAHLLVGVWTLAKLAYTKRQDKRKSAELKKVKLDMLSKLTAEEKGYLVPYIIEGQNTQYFSMEDGVVGGLTAKNILYRASNISARWTTFAFNMQPWAREHLEQNPQLLT